MPWIKKVYTGAALSNFIFNLLGDIENYISDTTIHGVDAWQKVSYQNTPYGRAFRVPNYKDGEYGYIGLMADKIRVGKSYWNWFKQHDVLLKEFVLNKNGLNLSSNSNFDIANGVVNINSMITTPIKVGVKMIKTPNGMIYPDDMYSINHSSQTVGSYRFIPTPEVFAKDADVLFFTMFKQFQNGLEWTELMGNERRSIKAKELRYYYTVQTYPSFFDPPLYPGTGCPALGFSPDFFKTVKNECSQDPNEKNVTTYLYKDRHRLIVVVNYLDHWDMATVGFFEPFDTQNEYAFPAMALGGTSGVLPLTELMSYAGEIPHIEYGFRLDYTEDNWSLSHGVPSHASTWWDGSNNFLDNSMYSQVQAMLPDGNWQSFANFGLQQDAYYSHLMGLYFSGHKEPEHIPKSRYFLTPSFTDLSKTTNIYPTGIQYTADLASQTVLQNKSIYQLEPIYFVQRSEDNINQNILGRIKNIYWCSQPVTRYGLYEINGKTYLIIPNAWENRKYHKKNYFSALLGEDQSDERQLSEMIRLERLSQSMNCAIQLSD